jgi:hypothetical protein
LIDRSIDHYDDPWKRLKKSEPEITLSDLDYRFNQAFLKEFGYSFFNYLKVCNQLIIIGDEQDSPAKCFPENQLKAKIAKEADISTNEVSLILNSITLKKRDNYLNSVGFDKWEVYPWNSNRRLSFLRKPLISIKREKGKDILWGNRHLFNTVEYLYNICYSGKVNAHSLLMKQFISDIRNEDGKAFNNEVYEAFTKYEDLLCRKRIDKFNGIEMLDEKGNLGDIDVLVVNRRKSKILFIECKNINAAISPYEYASELRELFVDTDKNDCETTKLLHRVTWVTKNIELVSRELKLDTGVVWEYQPILVTSEELFTPYLLNTSITSISLGRLVENFIPNWI